MTGYNRNRYYKFSWHTVFIVFLFIVFLATIQAKSYTKDIKTEISNRNGEVVDIDPRSMLTGPFSFVMKNDHVFKVTYKVNNEMKEAWVIFRMTGEEWDWEYIEENH